MIVRYTPCPVSSGVPALAGALIMPRPMLAVRITGPSGYRLHDGLLDTGADETVLNPSIAPRIGVDGLVLCEGFSSLREAGVAMGFPLWLTRLVPDVWDTVRRVGVLETPMLVVHSDVDGLFPMSMAKRVAEACGSHGELIEVSGLTHNAPIFAPTVEYWGPVAEWVKRRVLSRR